MEKCKFCDAQLEEGSTVCPGCGKDNAAQQAPVEETPAAETVAEQETAEVEQPAAAEGTADTQPASEAEAAPADQQPENQEDKETAPAEQQSEKQEDAKSETPAAKTGLSAGKLALAVAAVVVVIAIVVALVSGGKVKEPAQETPTEETAAEVQPTIPADGNPDDETCKGTYTITDEAAEADADKIVAKIGDHTLTNGQLRVFYWQTVTNYLSSNTGSYMMYYVGLDITQPLDTQRCMEDENLTWQQFFLKEALNAWKNYVVLSEKAAESGMEMEADAKAYLDSIEDNLTQLAQSYGLENAQELLKVNLGAGVNIEDFANFQRLVINGNLYYDDFQAGINPTAEELDAFFAQHEEDYVASGITKDGDFVDVRHVLISPEGGTTDENGTTTYSDAEWEACETKARELMNSWTLGDRSESSFAALAQSASQDPGSASNGGLYQNVREGQMVPEFNDWCFDEKREPGHSGIVKTDYGYHLMYFVGRTPIWEYYTRQDYILDKSNAMVQELIGRQSVDVDYGAITLGLVNLAG